MAITFERDPTFGWDPWLNDATLPSAAEIDAAVHLLPYSGADGFQIPLLPAGLNAYMSYVDNYGGWPALWTRFGKTGAFLVSITIFGNKALCADVEPYAMVVTDLPNWLDNVALSEPGIPPWVYTSASGWGDANRYVGPRRIIRWAAHYGFGPHVCGPRTCGYPQVDWTQWANSGPNGENYDRSVGLWLPAKPTVQEDKMAFVINENGKGELFVAHNSEVRHIVDQPAPTNWDTWLSLGTPPGGTIVSVTAGTNANGHVEVFAQMSNGTVQHKVNNQGWWPSWASLPAL